MIRNEYLPNHKWHTGHKKSSEINDNLMESEIISSNGECCFDMRSVSPYLFETHTRWFSVMWCSAVWDVFQSMPSGAHTGLWLISTVPCPLLDTDIACSTPTLNYLKALENQPDVCFYFQLPLFTFSLLSFILLRQRMKRHKLPGYLCCSVPNPLLPFNSF